MANIQGGSSTVNVANVDLGSNLNVTLPLDDTYAGKARIMSENDAGDITGTVELLSPETSSDYRLRTGMDSLFDNEFFNYAAQNTSKHKYLNTTMTMVWGGGFLTTNGTSITTTTTGTVFSTYRYFPVFGASTTYCEFSLALSNAVTTNTYLDIGLFSFAVANPYAPNDGVYLRINSSGFVLVSNYNGTETTQPLAFTSTINKVYEFSLYVGLNEVKIWINSVLYAVIPTPTGQGSPSMAGALPFSIRHSIVGGAAGAALQAKIGNYTVTVADLDNNRLWASVQAGMGNSSLQGSSGAVQGPTANMANSAAPAIGALANITPSYVTLGGQFQFLGAVGAETDYPLFAYVVPSGTTAITAKNLVIRGAYINTTVTGVAGLAVVTSPTIFQWALGVGSTAATLATADAAATRAPRKIPLGYQSFLTGTQPGGPVASVNANLDAPIVCEPGSYAHIILKIPNGAATAGLYYRGTAGINGYWE
jgi:hypothetical protein